MVEPFPLLPELPVVSVCLDTADAPWDIMSECESNFEH